mmetsp:Transcript_4086/g.10606  ORF Transcript_4086/g.10606 Transcript_4086/m.10606 type:complete len:167 (+) Transcript_4086:260-760(+)
MDAFVSPYVTLGVRSDASTEDIRHAYQRLAREHHPDRAGAGSTDGSSGSCSTEVFLDVQRAYDLLRDSEARRQHDAADRAARLDSAGAAARELEVDLDDMCYEEDQGTEEGAGGGSGGLWRYDCRCGDEFVLYEAQLMQGIEALHCRSCSYVLRPLYQQATAHTPS